MLKKFKRVDKRFLLIVPILIIGLVIFLVVMLSNKLTKLEDIKVREISDKVIPYIGEVINHGEEDGNYISFALDYLYNVENKDTFTIDELIEVINTYFKRGYTKEDANKIGLTSYLMNRGILYDSTAGGYVYKNSKTRADIAEIPLVKYEINKIKKVNEEKFVVTYDKYEITNPYSLLNYYNDQENPDSDTVKTITMYLKAESSVTTVYQYMTKDVVEKIGKKGEQIKIEYSIVDSKLKISKIG